MDKTQRTLVLLKPEAVKRELVGEIIGRLEKKFTLVGMKLITATKEEAEKHYHDKKDEDFFQSVVDCICAGPIVALCLEGEYAILSARNLIGATWPYNAHPSTIRGAYARHLPDNLIHGSVDKESADYECKLWFPELFT